MKTKSIFTPLIAAAFLVSATPLMTTPSWAEKSSVVGSPYENYHKSSASSDNILKKSGRGVKKGAVKVKDGFRWTGRKIKGIFTRD